MAELLLELFSEEIPARMQARAGEDLKRLVVDGLKAQGLEAGKAQAFATPRRLTLVVEDVPAKSPGVSEERKGPRVGAPAQAIAGFVKSAGLSSIEEATVVKDEKKGDFYVVKIERPGRKAGEIVATVIANVLWTFPWPKSMKWGESEEWQPRVTDRALTVNAPLRIGQVFKWVRPLHSIVCMLDGKVVSDLSVGPIKAGAITRGHRFHGNEDIKVEGFVDYATKLKAHKVLLLTSERMEMIREQAEAQAKAHKLELVADESLLAENAGLTEWPTVLTGSFDEAFLQVPAECLMLSMKQHQKCFSLRHPKSGKLANKFLAVSNLIAKDAGKQIVAGNEKVIAARLADARFFWEQDLKRPLDEMNLALKDITFHEKLGSQWDRVERVAELAHQIAGAVDAVPEDARRAAQLAKADLVSGMVGEFPELQGLMGRYYAEAAGTKPEIARAVELHYKPKGPSDTVPKVEDGDAVAVAVALADKLDTLIGFWAIGEKPTGSGDPYQLRRAALGVIRIVLENDLRLPLVVPLMAQGLRYLQLSHEKKVDVVASGIVDLEIVLNQRIDLDSLDPHLKKVLGAEAAAEDVRKYRRITADLLLFFADRLKVHLREKGARHDLIDAVFALGGQDDLALIVKRVEALAEFLTTDDGANLLAGVKRASNILSIEEKKDKKSHAGAPEGALLAAPEEKALAAAIAKVKFDTQAAINVENFAGAMRALSELRAPVDAFFDKVTVNAEDAKLRENRLKLLSEIRAATLSVADFSKIAG
jgi:glycyl-tRNA synthetase beta chain